MQLDADVTTVIRKAFASLKQQWCQSAKGDFHISIRKQKKGSPHSGTKWRLSDEKNKTKMYLNGAKCTSKKNVQ